MKVRFKAWRHRVMPLLAFGLALLSALPAPAGPLQDENLLAPLPQGFKFGDHSDNNGLSQTEYVPQNETVNDWTRMVTVDIFHRLPNFEPDAYGQKMADGWRSGCPKGSAQKIRSGVENSYRYSIWLLACPLNPQTNKPENMFMKVISGQDALYDVQYAYREDLNNDLIPPAMQFLRDVRVCDTRLKDRACPAGM